MSLPVCAASTRIKAKARKLAFCRPRRLILCYASPETGGTLYLSMTSSAHKTTTILTTCAQLAVVLIGLNSLSARAQVINQLFPVEVQSLNSAENESVLARPRTDYSPLGVHVGDFTITPQAGESFGYDSNINGLSSGPGSALLNTKASINVASDWSRDSLGGFLSVDNFHYLTQSDEDRTNWTASVIGSYNVGDDKFSGSYTHLNLNETAQDIGAVLTETPLPFTVDDVRLNYEIQTRSPLSLTPEAEYTAYRFSSDVIGGVNQDYRNRDVVQGGVTTRYELGPLRDLVFVVQGTHIDYTSSDIGIPDRDSNGATVLFGIDYSAAGVFRYRALVGYQVRQYVNSAYSNIAEPIFEGSVTWTPTLLTTVTANALRDIQDAADDSISGYTYTTGRIEVDHELRRNILLNAHTQIQIADETSKVANLPGILQSGGSETQYNVGIGATYLLNRLVHISATFDYNNQRDQVGTGSFTESVGLITVTFQL